MKYNIVDSQKIGADRIYRKITDEIFPELKETDDIEKYMADLCNDLSKDYIPLKRGYNEIEIIKTPAINDLTPYLFSNRLFPYAITYPVLFQYDEVMMSITPMEVASHLNPIRWAKGKVLIAGLGLGMVLNQILNKRSVKEVHLIDNDPDAIALYLDRFEQHPKLKIHEGDIFEFKSREFFDFFYMDIWATRIYEKFLSDQKRIFKKRDKGEIAFGDLAIWGIEEAIWGKIREGQFYLSEILEEVNMIHHFDDIMELYRLFILR